jgi:ankyrin repeat/BTB/POZ domain-containing protein 1
MRSMRGAFAENEEASDAEEDMFEDIVFNVDNKLFKCHKFFFCGRSEYFRALVTGNFKEGEGHIVAEAAIGHVSQASTHEITLTGVSAEAFVFLVDFMYTDNLNSALPFIQAMRRRDNQSQDGEEEADIEWQLIYEVLQLSDMYMLPVLRHLSTILLTQHINMSNLFDLIDIAQLMDLQRLYESIIQFMSLNLNEIFRQQKDALLEVIRKSASSIAERQETDTIPIVDDIRSALDHFYPTDSELTSNGWSDEYSDDEQTIMPAKHQTLLLLESLLDELGLSA